MSCQVLFFNNEPIEIREFVMYWHFLLLTTLTNPLLLLNSLHKIYARSGSILWITVWDWLMMVAGTGRCCSRDPHTSRVIPYLLLLLASLVDRIGNDNCIHVASLWYCSLLILWTQWVVQCAKLIVNVNNNNRFGARGKKKIKVSHLET